MRLPIVYLDDDIVAIDKPVGLSTHAAWYDVIPVDAVGILKAQLGADYLGTHQRLDRDTSGVMVFARRPGANAWLSEAFQDRAAGKEYLAVVHGAPTATGRIDAPIVPVGSGRYGVASGSARGGAQTAVTEYSVVARSPDRRLSLLRLHPLTGRTHQLRVHLAHIGAPIVGDTLYDPQARFFPRQLLHAHRLSLSTPSGPLTLEAQQPAIFETLLSAPHLVDLLQKASGSGSWRAWPDKGPQPLVSVLALAAERRRPIAEDRGNTAYCLLNGAGDGVPGLTVDRLGDVLCVEGAAEDAPDMGVLLGALCQVWEPRAIVAHSVRKMQSSEVIWGTLPGERWQVSEAGLRYVVGVDMAGTGLAPELREMRERVRALAPGRTVLNLFADTCAFGVAATAGGAARVLNLDRSRQRLERGMASYAANGFPAHRYDFVNGDAFDWLSRFQRRGQRFDLVIVSPPASRSEGRGRHDVERDWPALARQAAAVVAPGGLVLACSRQRRLSRRGFKELVTAGVTATGRPTSEVAYWRDPALDFPTALGDEGILKGLLLSIE